MIRRTALNYTHPLRISSGAEIPGRATNPAIYSQQQRLTKRNRAIVYEPEPGATER